MDPKILIAYVTAEYARRADFYDYYYRMDKPVGSVMTGIHGQSPAAGRNIVIRKALEDNFTHVMFIDDDVLVPQDALLRLLSHDKDVVSGLYLMRHFPHEPIIFRKANTDGRATHRYLTPDTKGLIEVVNCGLGCVLIKTEVFKALEDPWVTLGQLVKEHWCDDTDFFIKVVNAGFKIYCDTDVCCGHISSVALRPSYQNGQWITNYDTSSKKGMIAVPQIYSKD